MDRSTAYWIWLSLACGPASPTPKELFHRFGSIRDIYMAEEKAYRDAGLSDTRIQALCNKDLDAVRKIAALCEEKNIGVLTYQNPLYPSRLRRLQDPPAVLYYRGMITNLDDTLTVAVVGTRAISDEGRKITYRISYELALAGAVVVSGMALGNDGVAHTAALDSGGMTVAVLGSAIDHCYPREHQPLYDRLIAHGGILSEYPPGMITGAYCFPQRNRIISGICQATLVTEGDRKSGALITAHTAAVQGRDLYAIPGDPTVKTHEGTNALIKNGARPVTNVFDILSRYENLYSEMLDPGKIALGGNFENYDDRLRYGQDGVERRKKKAEKEETGTAIRSAPAELALREEPYDPEEFSENPETAVTTDRKKLPEAEMDDSPAPVSALPDDPGLSPTQSQILSLLDKKKTADELCEAGVPASSVLADLTLLEVGGYVRALPGGLFERIQ